MQRTITGFASDAAGDPVALLDCGHPQHVRHQPPFFERPWVTTEEGRRGMLGEILDCVCCDRFEPPEHLVAYKRTADFTADSVPDALRRDHATRTGVWARIVVLAGTLRYVVPSMRHEADLTPDRPGVVVPEVRHHVEPRGNVRFFVEFYRAPAGRP